MMFVYDIFDRCQIKYFMLGDIAKQLYDGQENYLEADKIEVGVMRGSLTKALYSIFKTYLPTGYKEVLNRHDNLKQIEFVAGDVPVVIRVFDKDYGVFKNLDLKFYDVEQVYLPNPFGVYWQKRGII